MYPLENYYFDHVHIYTKNLNKTAEFYKLAFGAKELRELVKEKMVHLDLNGIRIVISELNEENQEGLRHFALSIDKLDDSLINTLEGLDCNVIERKQVNNISVAFIKDPTTSTTIELVSPSTK